MKRIFVALKASLFSKTDLFGRRVYGAGSSAFASSPDAGVTNGNTDLFKEINPQASPLVHHQVRDDSCFNLSRHHRIERLFKYSALKPTEYHCILMDVSIHIGVLTSTALVRNSGWLAGVPARPTNFVFPVNHLAARISSDWFYTLPRIPHRHEPYMMD